MFTGKFLTPNSYLTTHHGQIYGDRDTQTHTLESIVQRMSECSAKAVLFLKRFFLARRAFVLCPWAGRLRAPESLKKTILKIFPSSKVD